MKKRIFLLTLVLVLFLLFSIRLISASAIFLGCDFKAEVFKDDYLSFLRVIETSKEQCEKEVEENEIYSFNDFTKTIKDGAVIKVQEQGACPLGLTGVSTCHNWWTWTANLSSYAKDSIYLEKLICQKNDDCSPYSVPVEADCGGCKGQLCSEYIPINCYLYKNNVSCVNNVCVSNGIVENKVIETQSFWQKIMSWFKRLFGYNAQIKDEQNFSLEKIRTLCQEKEGIAPDRISKCQYKGDYYFMTSASCSDCGNSYYDSRLKFFKGCPGMDIYRDIDDICYKVTNCSKVTDC